MGYRKPDKETVIPVNPFTSPGYLLVRDFFMRTSAPVGCHNFLPLQRPHEQENPFTCNPNAVRFSAGWVGHRMVGRRAFYIRNIRTSTAAFIATRHWDCNRNFYRLAGVAIDPATVYGSGSAQVWRYPRSL